MEGVEPFKHYSGGGLPVQCFYAPEKLRASLNFHAIRFSNTALGFPALSSINFRRSMS